LGGLLWGGGMSLLGFMIGNRIPGLDHYLEKAILAVMLISILAAIGHLLKDPKTRNLLTAKLKNIFSKIFLNKRID
ncbi:hypothetical protein KDA11_05145, partial [Candidatus Saccharibacteria bacterium]|nr:hypothetical protein [Candidatus Saccharibacteria bacterium]